MYNDSLDKDLVYKVFGLDTRSRVTTVVGRNVASCPLGALHSPLVFAGGSVGWFATHPTEEIVDCRH